jgi:general secretion pathway protein G
MRRGFSLIELIFVIVILGVLASVAIPKMHITKNEALISSEKQVIGYARQNLVMLHTKRVVTGRDFKISLTNIDNEEYRASIIFTKTLFPHSLSIKDNSQNALTDNNLDYSDTLSKGSRKVLALAIEPESLTEWEKIDGSADSTHRWRGLASTIINDSNYEISNTNYWEYNNTSGKIFLR